jgi:Family of unknown function (DUF6011)
MAWDDPISEGQIRKLHVMMKLHNVSNLPAAQETFLRKGETCWRRMDRRQAHAAIEALGLCDLLPQEAPKLVVDLSGANPSAPVEGVEITSGRYWIIDPADNSEKFLKVNRPDEGRWKGYTFMDIQAGPNYWAVRNRETRERYIAEIAKDPLEAMRQYGLRLGVCGRCGLPLTDEVSRYVGFGHICADNLGIPYEIDPVELDDNDLDDLLGEE